MGFSVGNRHGNEQFSNRTWCWILNTAKAFGWEPSGTFYPYEMRRSDLERSGRKGDELRSELAKEASEWDGGYHTNDGQIISATDAAALADALEKALAKERDQMTEEIKTLLADLIPLCRTGDLQIV